MVVVGATVVVEVVVTQTPESSTTVPKPASSTVSKAVAKAPPEIVAITTVESCGI